MRDLEWPLNVIQGVLCWLLRQTRPRRQGCRVKRRLTAYVNVPLSSYCKIRYVSKCTAASRGSPCDSTAFLLQNRKLHGVKNVGVSTALKWPEKNKQLEIEGSRTPVPHSWCRQWLEVALVAGRSADHLTESYPDSEFDISQSARL